MFITCIGFLIIPLIRFVVVTLLKKTVAPKKFVGNKIKEHDDDILWNFEFNRLLNILF